MMNKVSHRLYLKFNSVFYQGHISPTEKSLRKCLNSIPFTGGSDVCGDMVKLQVSTIFNDQLKELTNEAQETNWAILRRRRTLSRNFIWETDNDFHDIRKHHSLRKRWKNFVI